MQARTLAILALPIALAQTPAFETATIKISQATTGGAPLKPRGNRIAYLHTTLKTALGRAYNLKGYQIDGPNWITTERYDIVAAGPEGSTASQVPLMLQNLLTERFKLTIHRERREIPAYALVVKSKSPNLEEAPAPEVGGHLRVITGPGNSSREFRATTMLQLIDFVSPALGRPVLDRTNLAGGYNFRLDLSMEELGGMKGNPAAEDHASIFTLLEAIGLKLEPVKAPFEILVVDSGNRTTVEN
jgi:uncharacterized protein (TIGR03435 family)